MSETLSLQSERGRRREAALREHHSKARARQFAELVDIPQRRLEEFR